MTSNKQFSGRELFIIFYMRMNGVSMSQAEHEWDNNAGKQKKAAWIYLASQINELVAG